MSAFLFHGTRYGAAIMGADRIRCAPYGDTHVSLTSDLACALYWAELERDDDEGRGCILVLSRERMAAYSPQPFESGCSGPGDVDEEAVRQDITPLSAVLVMVIWPGGLPA